jgi:hypothetical protein
MCFGRSNSAASRLGRRCKDGIEVRRLSVQNIYTHAQRSRGGGGLGVCRRGVGGGGAGAGTDHGVQVGLVPSRQ